MDLTLYILLLLVGCVVAYIKFYGGEKEVSPSALKAFEYKQLQAQDQEEAVVSSSSASGSLRHRNKSQSETPKGLKEEVTPVKQEPIVDVKEKEQDVKEEVKEVKEAQETKPQETEDKKEDAASVVDTSSSVVEPEVTKEEKEEKVEEKEEEEKKDEAKEDEDKDEDEDEDEEEDDDDDEDDDDEVDEDEDLHEVVSSSAIGKSLAVSVSFQGKRPNNEDRIVIQSSSNVHFCGVFDGHDGPSASTYCAKYMVKNITRNKKFPASLPAALKAGFIRTDKGFLNKVESGGTTAVVVAIDEEKSVLHVANAGDSRCIASVDGSAVALSTDHKPNLPEETERINKTNHDVQITTEIVLGQRVKIARIDGALAVSRALGDQDFKDDPSLSPHEQAVSPVPDVITVELSPKHEFVVLACDGLWDVLSNQEVVDFIKPKISSSSTSEDIVAVGKSLVGHAINDKRSTDNVTVIIIKL